MVIYLIWIKFGPICDPSKLKIRGEKGGVGASYDDIRILVGNIEELNYVKVKEAPFSCLDGRFNNPILGTPGGDAGEFILSLSVYEDLLGGGRKLSQGSVDHFFGQYLQFMKPKKFIMCTDDFAINHVERELNIEGINILNPRQSLMNHILNAAIKPENIGDLHLKMMLKYPKQFSIRREMVEMFLISFYKILWNKELEYSRKLELVVLAGTHKESAFIEVRSDHACQANKLAPLLITKNRTIMSFVNHLDAASIRRGQLAKFYSNKVNHHQDPVNRKTMHNRLNHHGYIALEITGSYIARGLPFYTVLLA